MSRTARQTAIGVTFLVVGLVLVSLAVLPVVLGAVQHPPVHADVSLWFLFTGLAVAIFGALVIPGAGAQAALTVIVTTAAPYLPTFGRRKGDTGGQP